MNREDIIRMAREAEWLHEYDSETGFVADAAFKFAALVASAEREACAKVCEEMRTYVGRNNAVTQSSAQDCAAAIRSRGQA